MVLVPPDTTTRCSQSTDNIVVESDSLVQVGRVGCVIVDIQERISPPTFIVIPAVEEVGVVSIAGSFGEGGTENVVVNGTVVRVKLKECC